MWCKQASHKNIRIKYCSPVRTMPSSDSTIKLTTKKTMQKCEPPFGPLLNNMTEIKNGHPITIYANIVVRIMCVSIPSVRENQPLITFNSAHADVKCTTETEQPYWTPRKRSNLTVHTQNHVEWKECTFSQICTSCSE